MKFRFLLLLAAFLSTGAMAQSVNDAATSTRIQEKIRRVELLTLIIPVLLTGEQLTTLLPVVVKARKADEDLKKKEAAILRGLEADLDKSIKDGADSKTVPKGELINKINTAFAAMTMARGIMVEEQLGLVMAEVDKVLDAGQKKAAGGLIAPNRVKPSDPASATDGDRLKFWVQNILLDPLSTDILQRLSRAK